MSADTTTEVILDDTDDNTDDACDAGLHSWEYLYSVYKCNSCEEISEDD